LLTTHPPQLSGLHLVDDVPAMAVRAPDRIVGDDSEWRELWEESEDGGSALAAVLTAHPEAQQRMRAELAAVLPDRMATADDAARLTYTAGVWRETLRLYPPAWLIARRLTADRTIAGHRLAAGSMLLISPWVVHRDPTWWNDPETFRPERWIEAGDRSRQAYFPFGGGVRQCIGNRFADLEGILILATVLPDWRVRLPTGSARPVPLPQITLRHRDGMPLIVERFRSCRQ
jgi:cytochrome P450